MDFSSRTKFVQRKCEKREKGIILPANFVEFSKMSILPSAMDTIKNFLVDEVFHVRNDCCCNLICSDFLVQVEAVSLYKTGGLLIVKMGCFKQQG